MESTDPSIPKSPSKPTSAVFTKGQRSAWRSCDKPKLKRHKSFISAFPITSRSSASNSSDSSSGVSISILSSGAKVLPTRSPTPDPPVDALQVVQKPNQATQSTAPVSRAKILTLATHQAKITNYFLKKSPQHSMFRQTELPASDEIDIVMPSQSNTHEQSLRFEPVFTSTQADFDPEHESGPDEEQSEEESDDEQDEIKDELDEHETMVDGFIVRSSSPSLIALGSGATSATDIPTSIPTATASGVAPEITCRPVTFPEPRTPTSSRNPITVGETTMDVIRNFDRIPARQSSPPSPGYAYKPEKAVRKKDDRARLPGWICDMCRDYYEAIASQLTDEELQKLKDKCSRHRYKYAPNLNNTPPGYWDVDFPTTQECIEKGYMGIGVRTPPSNAGTHRTSRGGQLPLLPVSFPSSPSPCTSTSLSVNVKAIPISPVKPISPCRDPKNKEDGKLSLRKSFSTSKKAVTTETPSSKSGWKGIKQRARVKRPKPKACKHPSQVVISPMRPPPLPCSPSPPISPAKRPEPKPSPMPTFVPSMAPPPTSTSLFYQRELALFDDLDNLDGVDQETMLDSEDYVQFRPLSPSLTPKWPRSDKVISVPQLRIGIPEQGAGSGAVTFPENLNKPKSTIRKLHL